MITDGKIALVTGGSRGIGRAIAIRLSEMGVFTFINYFQNTKSASETLRIIRDKGGDGKICQFDVSDFEGTQKAIKNIVDEQGRIDILVNNAGISNSGFFVRTREKEWDTMIEINLKGVFNCCRAVTKSMMKQRRGRIINMSSVVAEGGNSGQVCYSASKAGIIGLTKSLAKELGPRNICVNAVAPGFIDSDMTSSLSEEIRETIIDQIPLSKSGTPEDVAGVVAFLVSRDADYITGQVLHVNGGVYM